MWNHLLHNEVGLLEGLPQATSVVSQYDAPPLPPCFKTIFYVYAKCTNANGYPISKNLTSTRIKWRRVCLRKPMGVLIGKNLHPSGPAEAGTEVLNPYPLTHRPCYDI
jgi:hypothetical protein